MGLNGGIVFAQRRHSAVVICDKVGEAFASTQICQHDSQPKQRCQKCECERVMDMISKDCLSLTDKTSRCAFRTSILHRPSSLPITKDRLKYASLFLLRERWSLPLKNQTLPS